MLYRRVAVVNPGVDSRTRFSQFRSWSGSPKNRTVSLELSAFQPQVEMLIFCACTSCCRSKIYSFCRKSKLCEIRKIMTSDFGLLKIEICKKPGIAFYAPCFFRGGAVLPACSALFTLANAVLCEVLLVCLSLMHLHFRSLVVMPETACLTGHRRSFREFPAACPWSRQIDLEYQPLQLPPAGSCRRHHSSASVAERDL